MLKLIFAIYIIQLLAVAIAFGLDHFEKTGIFKTKEALFEALKPWTPYKLLYKKISEHLNTLN